MADEHRFGLILAVRRCWTLRGLRPSAPYQTKYEWGYLNSALEVDGANAAEFACLPGVSLDLSRLFLERLAARNPEAEPVVIWIRPGSIRNPVCMNCPRASKCCHCHLIVPSLIPSK